MDKDYKKLYEEALERARKINSGEGVAAPSDWTICEVIFPELRESEDEKIRKAIICGMNALKEQHKETFASIPINDCIAWLEKQGEQKAIDKIQLGKKYKCIASPRYSTFMKGEIYKPEDKFVCSLMNLCSDCFEPIEEDGQKPDNPTWSEEDEKIINTIISDITRIRTSCGIGTEEYNIRLEALNWLKSLKPQQKQEWDNKDNGILNCLITTLCEEEHGGIETNKRFVNWLKSLKDRVQPQTKQEWSEEDEEMYHRIISDCEAKYVLLPNEVDWLKSLRHKNRWKPSEYDISLLEEIARNIRNNVRPFCSEVSSLEDLIKNLKNL